MRVRSRLAALSAATAAAGALVTAAPAAALDCASFKTAVESATNGDVITLDAGLTCHETYVLPGDRPAPFSITIQGGGAGATLDGSGKTASIVKGAPEATGDQLDVTIRNLTFRNGTATVDGGGAISLGRGDVGATLDRDHFLNNEGGPTGGAALIEATAGGRPIVVTNSTFGDGTAAGANRANSVGALVALTHDGGPSVKIAGNEFRRNVSNNGAGAAYVLAARPGTSVTVNGNRFSDNRAGANGGGALIAGHTVTVARNIFVANRIHADQYEDAFGGGLAVDSLAGRGTLTQAGNRFDGNRITRGSQAHFEDGGAGESIHGYDVTSRNDRFTRNSLTAPAGDGRALGGGLEIVGCAPYPAPPAPLAARLENAVVAGNSTGPGTHGAGIFASGCGDAWTVLDSTIAGNSTSGAGATAGLSGNLDDKLTMRNSILVRNPGGPDVTGFGGGRTITRSDVCSPGPSPGPIVGAGNICADPRLIDARSGNVHETVFSRTINRGRNADIPAGLKTDYEGDPRVLLGRVDMGADEYRDPFAGVAIADQAVTVENGTAEVLVRCPANARTPCAGTLKLMRSGKELGRGDFSIKRAKHARVAVHLNQRGRDALADHGTLEVFARATATDGFGTSRKRAAKVTLKG